MRALDADERRNGVRTVGQQQVVVRGDEIQHDRGDDDEADERAGDVRRADLAPHQNSARCSPPSTAMVCPVT